MDSLSFIAKLIDALAWPSATVLIVILLRDPVFKLIPFLHKLKYKDFELEFSRTLEAAAVEVQRSLPETAVPEPKIITHPQPGQLLALFSPSAAIVEAWKDLELAALELLRRRNLLDEKKPKGAPNAIISKLRRIEELDSGIIDLIHEMRKLRNIGVHEYDAQLTSEQAEKYSLICRKLADSLRSL